MITIEYYTLDDEGKTVKVDQVFTITQNMIVRLLEEHINLDSSIGEEILMNRLFLLKELKPKKL